MSYGLERARERAGHVHRDVELQRAIDAAIHAYDEERHRAVKAETALSLLSEAVCGPRKSGPVVLENVARLLAAQHRDDEWQRYLGAAGAVVDYLQAEGVVA